MDRSDIFSNRAFLYGDGVFETVRIHNGRVLFAEDHYFRLMASMRILRMEIPMDLTLDHFETLMCGAADEAQCLSSARVRITVYRKPGGLYLPQTNDVDYSVEANAIGPRYGFDGAYEAELYKDAYLSAQLLSTIKSTNRIMNVLASIFASENGYDTCLLMNEKKNIVEAINGNIFIMMSNRLLTPPLSEGCINGVMRRQVLAIARNIHVSVEESIVSPFDLQNADEIFVTNVIQGIRPITKYRKKEFKTEFAGKLAAQLNEIAGLA